MAAPSPPAQAPATESPRARGLATEAPGVTPWLAILGIGEDGCDGLSPAARALLAGAEAVFGGARHLALAAPLLRGEAHPWPSPMADAYPAILARRGRPVAVLASGDPFRFGVGSALARLVPAAERIAVPAPSSIALACARLGWAEQDCAVVSLCGRPPERVLPLLQPGARLVTLSADAGTPAALAALLTAHGFGPSRLHLLEALGGPRERHRESRADGPGFPAPDPLNLVAVEVAAGPGARIVPLSAGLPDGFFEHDGQLTKQEVRAVTLSALAPRQGERLWDIGLGSGSIAIEWLLRHPANRALGIEPDPARAARAARNALSLGVPGLEIVAGEAPAALAGLPPPDAVFIGGGVSRPGVLEAAWAALPPGGRLVANGVTVEGEAALLAAHSRWGGSLTRIGIERLDSIGRLHAFRPAMTVTQYAAVKP